MQTHIVRHTRAATVSQLSHSNTLRVTAAVSACLDTTLESAPADNRASMTSRHAQHLLDVLGLVLERVAGVALQQLALLPLNQRLLDLATHTQLVMSATTSDDI